MARMTVQELINALAALPEEMKHKPFNTSDISYDDVPDFSNSDNVGVTIEHVSDEVVITASDEHQGVNIIDSTTKG